MTVQQANNEDEGHPRWGRARTDSAFQSAGSVVGPSATSSPYFNPYNEIPYPPVVSGAAASGLTPVFVTFGVLRPVPATQSVHENWSPITGLPGADLSAYSLQAHRGTQVAHGNITLDSYWDRQLENIHSQYDRLSFAAAQAQGTPLQLATGTYGRTEYYSYPRDPRPSVTEGIVGRSLSDATNRPRPTPRLPSINVDVANGKATSPQTPNSTISSEPDTAFFSPASGSVAFTNPFRGAVGTGLGTPEAAASPHDQAIFTPQSAVGPATPFPDTPRTPQTPSRHRRPSRANEEREFNKEEKDFILYLSLQGIRSEAVGVELSRITRQLGNHMGLDLKGKMIGLQVAACLRKLSQSKGSDEDAERTVTELMSRAEREGWSQGVLSRAKEYSHSLTRGKSIAYDAKDRKHDARCRAIHKKWRINHPEDLPREDAKMRDEKMAYLGMMLEGTAQEADGPDERELKKNLLELWESFTIAGKAVK